MEQNSIKNIVFDWGGVLVDLDAQQTRLAFKELGMTFTDDEDYTPEQWTLFHAWERGDLSIAEFHEQVRSFCTSPLTDQQIDDAWCAMLTEIPVYKLEELMKLKKQYRLFLLSNTNPIHYERCRGTFNYLGWQMEDYFEQIFLSHQLRALKPTPDIFQKVMAQAGIRPEETLLIDDLPANCQTARELGFQVYCPARNSDWRAYVQSLSPCS